MTVESRPDALVPAVHIPASPVGKIHFWLTFIGFHTTFLVQHVLGNEGMPRRYADYLPSDGFQTLNVVSSVGAAILGVSVLPFVWNVFRSWRYGDWRHPRRSTASGLGPKPTAES